MATTTQDDWPLSPDEYLRYGRQMIMPEWGLGGQLSLKSARVAVVGAGGLGCPVLQYLAGSGVGTISIFDHDTVSVSNLHRQVLHSTERVGRNKAESAVETLRGINPHVTFHAHMDPILPSTALAQLADHDLVVDCTDRPETRYLISDAAVALGIPLVSGAAVGSAGQWAVYGGTKPANTASSTSSATATAINSAPAKRACYRCLWPRAAASQRCDEAGVWGPVTGMVGSGMAALAMQVLMGQGEQVLHVLHLGASPMVRTVKMRPRKKDCPACGDTPSISVESEDYSAFCGTVVVDESTGNIAGGEGERVNVTELRSVLGESGVVVVDTRPNVEYDICALPHTTNIPLATILRAPDTVPDAQRVVFLCRRGNDSQVAAAKLRTVRPGAVVQDVRGGLGAWSRHVDTKFPIY